MSANGGEIVVQLRMEDGQYKVAVVQAGDLMRQLKGRLDQTSSSVQKLEQHADSMGRKFRDVVMTLGNLRFVAMDINDIFLRLPMSILKTAGEMERLQALMTGLSKETDAAARKAEGLSNFKFVTGLSKTVPFEVAALGDAFVKFKTAGLDPTNGSMMALVDSVARFGGTSESLKRASVAIQQMSGKGVVSMEELRQQLGEAVPSAMQSMADGMGMTMAELTKIVSKGVVQSGPALKKMLLQMRIENQGAADEMMKTWGGMTSRLKTEWQLTSQFIADAGFGDAAKRAVLAMTDALGTDEFRRFGSDAGAAMGNAVSSMVQFVQTLIRFRDEIGLAVQGWLAYKAVTSLIVPMSNSLRDHYKSTTEVVKTQAGAVREAAILKQKSAIDEITSARNVASAEKLRSLDVITAKKLETQLVRDENARILADYNRLNASLLSYSSPNRDETRRRLQDMSMVMAENTRVAAANAAEIRNHQVIVQSSNKTLAEKTAELGKVANGWNAAGIAAGAATAATRAFGSVLNFMGGWVGVAVTALGVLAAWWYKAAGAAKEYESVARRAGHNVSTDEDAEVAKDELTKRQAQYDALKANADSRQRRVINTGTRVVTMVDKTPQEIERDIKAMEVGFNRLQEAKENLQKVNLSLLDRHARDQSQASQVISARQLALLDDQSRKEIGTIEKAHAKYLEGKDRNNKEVLAESQKFVIQRTVAFKNGIEKKVAYENSVIEDAQKKILSTESGTKENLAANQVLEASQARLAAFQNELKNVVDTMGLKNGINVDKKDKKAPGQSKFEHMIADLKANRERLKAEIDGLNGTAQEADKVEGAVKKIESLIASGEFGKLSKSKAAELVSLVRGKADDEKAKDDLEKQIAQIEKVTSYLNGMRPEIEDAMELLADPLGSVKAGRKERSTEKWIAGNMAEIEAYALRHLQTIEQVTSGIQGGAIAIDDAKTFSDLARETKQLNDSLVDDSRLAAKARMEADNERHRASVENLIKERVLNGQWNAQQAADAQKTLASNVAARVADVAQKSKSPMDKMAENWKNAALNMEEASVGWANKTMDSMTEMVMTGKADFSSLAKSIIADIVRINLQKAAGQGISSAMGFAAKMFAFADGGIMSSMGSMPLKKYAAGGVANSPQLAVFGEGSMNEAYVPLPDGRTIPVTLKGGGSGSNVSINITVNKSGASSSESSGDNAAAYKQMADRIKGVVQDELVRQSRPGGMLYK